MIDEDRFCQGMSTERYHPWYGNNLMDAPVPGVEGIAGAVAIISLHGPEGGCTYEQTEGVGGNHHRGKASGVIPTIVRPA